MLFMFDKRISFKGLKKIVNYITKRINFSIKQIKLFAEVQNITKALVKNQIVTRFPHLLGFWKHKYELQFLDDQLKENCKC